MLLLHSAGVGKSAVAAALLLFSRGLAAALTTVDAFFRGFGIDSGVKNIADLLKKV